MIRASMLTHPSLYEQYSNYHFITIKKISQDVCASQAHSPYTYSQSSRSIQNLAIPAGQPQAGRASAELAGLRGVLVEAIEANLPIPARRIQDVLLDAVNATLVDLEMQLRWVPRKQCLPVTRRNNAGFDVEIIVPVVADTRVALCAEHLPSMHRNAQIPQSLVGSHLE